MENNNSSRVHLPIPGYPDDTCGGSIFPWKTAKQEVFLRDPASLIRLANIIIVATSPLCKNSAKFINIQPLVGSHSPSSNALA